MNDDELERLLRDSFDARSLGAVGDGQQPPPPRFAASHNVSIAPETLSLAGHRGSRHRAPAAPRSRLARYAMPLSAAAAIVVVTGVVLALVGHGSGTDDRSRQRLPVLAGPYTSSSHVAASQSSTAPAAPKVPVHISLLNADGSKYGVGMPEIAYFSKKFSSGVALQKATTVTVNGKPAEGAWYLESSAAGNGPVEGHFRLQHYWPAHSKVLIKIATKGVSAGGNKVFDDSLTSSWSTGAADIATVDDSSHTLTLTVDGKKEGTYPVSLGAADTPTKRGTKVIMEKGASICMSGPGYDECGVKWTQRLTYDGEYLHSAPWNASNIEHGVDSSNGCTNLLPGDAQHLYDILRIGDVVEYPNADGPSMQLGSGYGDWNVPWGQWLTGGLAPTH